MSGRSAIELARAAVRIADPEEGLAAVAELRERLDALEALHVENAVRSGWSWRQVAEALGVTKQAAHKKHARRVAANVNEPGRTHTSVSSKQRIVQRGGRTLVHEERTTEGGSQ